MTTEVAINSFLAGDFSVEVAVALTPTPQSRPIDTIFGFSTGNDILLILDASVLDREDIDRYMFTVEAADTSSETSTATVTIMITDVNDEVPFITNPG